MSKSDTHRTRKLYPGTGAGRWGRVRLDYCRPRQQSMIKFCNLVSAHPSSTTLYLPARTHRITNPVMALCTVCKGIPTNFFGPLPPNFFSPSDRIFHYRHHTPSALCQSAAKGCPMCKILVCQLNDHWLPQRLKIKNGLR